MIVKVHEHTLEINESPVNELEINVTKIQFVFDEIMQDFVKEAYFTLNDEQTYKVLIQNDECYIPNEVLVEKGQIELGVVAFKIENDNEIRFNPKPVYFATWKGSLKEADNTEPITPTDKEQIEQQLQDISNQMDNIDIEAEKVEHTTTITITRKDGTTEQVQVLDGEQGPQGERGPAGVIRIIICPNGLPETGEEGPLYEVPKEEPTTQDLYDEYMWVDNKWELMGEKKIAIDLTDYVKNTDYATASKGGVIKSGYYGLQVDSTNGKAYCDTYTYANYGNVENQRFVSKGTLENVITGKGLVSNTDYANSSTGGVIKTSNYYDIEVDSDGALRSKVVSYANYPSESNNAFISKGTLNNVLTATIGDIQTLLDNLDSGNGV